MYINEKGECDDDTFERFQQLISVPIMFVKYSNCEKYLKKYNPNDYAKSLNTIKLFGFALLDSEFCKQIKSIIP